ncbi:MAG: site-specific integrase [Oscillospiraceae bacterium]
MARKRKNGDGTVRLRKDGRWEGRIVVDYDDNGYPKTKNVLAKTKIECLEKLRTLKETCGGSKSARLRPEMPFGDWLTYWYEHHSKPKLRPTTQANYENCIRLHIAPEIGKIPLNKLTQNDLQQFYARLKKTGRLRYTRQYGAGLSDRMVRMCHAVCRTALERAVQDGMLRTNPAIGCKLPPKKAREMQVLDREELQRLLIQAKAEGYYELFLLDLSTGLRRGELMALQWEDLDFKTGALRVNKQVYEVKGELQLSTPKTKTSVRQLTLPPAVVAVLKEYRETVDSRWMFPSPVKEDCPVTPCAIRSRLQLILKHAGCKHVRFHDLRHTFATLSLQNGMDVKTLSAMLGHVSAATTLDIYTHITDDMRQSAAASIDRGIGKVEPEQGNLTAAPTQPEAPRMTDFKPYQGCKRKPGTGCVSEINDHLFEGRYSPMWPDGKKHSRNIYAHTREECEEKLKVLIVEMKEEVAEQRKSLKAAPQIAM